MERITCFNHTDRFSLHIKQSKVSKVNVRKKEKVITVVKWRANPEGSQVFKVQGKLIVWCHVHIK